MQVVENKLQLVWGKGGERKGVQIVVSVRRKKGSLLQVVEDKPQEGRKKKGAICK